MALEINLVPDIKGEMIKALKLRNLIFFICIVVASASVGVSIIFATIAGGQQAVVDGKKGTLTLLSEKVNNYSDLGDFLTIKDQLGNLSSIANNKQLLSRSFGILAALLPTGADTITLSELSINLSNNNPTFSFDAQANAGAEPFIDYNVLDSFKKSMQYMRYDYGEYVDRYGAAIPAYCIIESGINGATFSDPSKGIYALWLIEGEDCNPSAEEIIEEEVEEEENLEEDSENPDGENSENSETPEETPTEPEVPAGPPTEIAGYPVEQYNVQGTTQNVVRIWRTPQFNDWYKEDPAEDEPYMTLDGAISNVPHFESSCISYSGTEVEAATDEKPATVTWETYNDTCLLVPDGIDGIRISDSSNGRGASEELVLRFSATITLNPEVFSFSNKHVLAIAPSGRFNVTDSYVQIQNMFAERAADCAPGDTACNNNTNIGEN